MRIQSWFAGLFALGLMLATSAQAGPWIKAESEHFVVYSNTDEAATRGYLTHLEQYRYILGELYHVAPEQEAATPKLELYFVRTFDDLKQSFPRAGKGVLGYFSNNSEGTFALGVFGRAVVHESKTALDQPENDSQVIIFHEFAHDFMFRNSTLRFPPWYVEGFAEFYDTTKIQGDQAVIGMEWSMRAYTIKYGRGIPYEDILRSKASSLQNDRQTADFYAQSWLLSHYILTDPDRRRRFAAYVKAYDAGADPVTAFETAFDLKVKQLPDILSKYRDGLKASIVQVRGMPQPNITVTAMPASSDKLILWNLAVLPMSPLNPRAKPLLEQIRQEAAKYPGDDFAQIILARAEVILGDESRPVAFLEGYVAAHPDDGTASFLLGQSYFLMTNHDHILPGETAETQMQKARAAMVHAYQVDPKNASNLYYLSIAQHDRPDFPNETAVNAAIQAHNLEPGVKDFAVWAAQLLIMKDRLDEAKTMLYIIAGDPHGGDATRWASNIITAIDNGTKKEDLLEMLKRPPSDN